MTISKDTIANRAVAGVVWCAGVFTTWQFCAALAPNASAYAVVGVAVALQAACTALESPIWRGKGGIINYAALLADVISNIGGLFVFLMNLDQTASYDAMRQAFSLQGEMSPLSALIIAIILGILMAASPENLWREVR
jgi:hypothetical protein